MAFDTKKWLTEVAQKVSVNAVTAALGLAAILVSPFILLLWRRVPLALEPAFRTTTIALAAVVTVSFVFLVGYRHVARVFLARAQTILDGVAELRGITGKIQIQVEGQANHREVGLALECLDRTRDLACRLSSIETGHIPEASGAIAELISRTFSELFHAPAHTPVTVCIKYLTVPKGFTQDGHRNSLKEFLDVGVRRLAIFPEAVDHGPFTIGSSAPTRILFERPGDLYFLESNLSSQRHLPLHPNAPHAESLLVVRISYRGMNLGFLWISSSASAVFDNNVATRLALRLSDELGPLIERFLRPSQATLAAPQ